MTAALPVDPSRHVERRLRRQYLHAFVAAACVGPFLSYVLTDVGWTPREIGWATALLTASAVVTAPVWGWADDTMSGGAARLSLFVTALAAGLLTLSLTAGGKATTLACVAVLGSASGSLEALLTSHTLRDARTAARLGATRSLGSVGWILGLFLGGLLLTITGRAALVFLVAGVAALTAPTQRRPERRRELEGRARPKRALLPVGEVLYVLSITFPFTLCIATLTFFTAGWARDDLGAGPLAAVGPLAFSAALELPAFLLIDRVARRVSPGWLCTLAFPPLGLAALTLSQLPSRGVLFAVQPLVAVSFTLWFVGQSRLMAARVPVDQLASALTLLSTLGRGIAGPLAGIAGGALAAAGGYTSLFLSMAAVCALGLLRALPVALRSPASRGAPPAAVPPRGQPGRERPPDRRTN